MIISHVKIIAFQTISSFSFWIFYIGSKHCSLYTWVLGNTGEGGTVTLLILHDGDCNRKGLLAGTGCGHIYTPLGHIIGHVYQSMITLILLYVIIFITGQEYVSHTKHLVVKRFDTLKPY